MDDSPRKLRTEKNKPLDQNRTTDNFDNARKKIDGPLIKFEYCLLNISHYCRGIFYRWVSYTPQIIHVESILSILSLINPNVGLKGVLFINGNFTLRFTTVDALLKPIKPNPIPTLIIDNNPLARLRFPCTVTTADIKEWNKYRSELKVWYKKRCSEINLKIKELKAEVDKKYKIELEIGSKIKKAYLGGDPTAVETVARVAITRNPISEQFCLDVETCYDKEAKVLLATIEVPDFKQLKIYKLTKSSKTTEVSATEKKKLSGYILYALCIRSAYLVTEIDEMGMYDTVAVNASQKWFDSATGVPCEGIIASFQASKDSLLKLQIENVDPKACFRHFSGIATPSIERVAPVRPIFIMDKNDSRHIEGRDVDKALEVDTNLASMPWDDFEHLVRQLFEWEFGRNGVEVKVTRASRDRGVDAIMYDPNLLTGGKYVLQAKRYTRTVDVAAVRDLYGTVINEGANRGILVTTSGYGPDTYDFAKDKPISLVDGPALVQMLLKHGRKYRIDLEEARRIERELLQ